MENGSPSNLRDEDLVAMCQRGEHQAFETLVLRYMKRAYRIAFDFTHNGEDAKDLSQEAFLRAFLQIKHFNRKSTFYTWLYRIVVNLCLDHHRRKGRVPWERLDGKNQVHAEETEMADASSTPDQEAMAGEVKRKLGSALGTLPGNQRTAFLLRNHHGLSISEIAKVMETTEGTVRVHLHRAVTSLRQSLAELV
jgi:RNA polymerase sigma-70 factor (ECF subfamily)